MRKTELETIEEHLIKEKRDEEASVNKCRKAQEAARKRRDIAVKRADAILQAELEKAYEEHTEYMAKEHNTVYD